jgi:glycosyltransferase involved in cell wall biosynthesis
MGGVSGARRLTRLAVYSDDNYHRQDGVVYGERAFSIFLARLRPFFDRLVLVGRLSPGDREGRYSAGEAELLALPYYPKLSAPLRAAPALGRSIRTFWRALEDVDCLWLMGPHPLALVFAVLARVRRKRVVLGVRQDLPEYVRSRHPRRVDLQVAASILEGAFRLLAHRLPVVVVGPGLAENYRRSRALLEIVVSLVDEADLATPETVSARRYDGDIRILSVGRIESEKNPLLLAETLARLNASRPRWRLTVCGEGDLAGPLAERLQSLGQSDYADLRGYVPFGRELTALYRESHVLLHSSFTEGFPQVFLEAFAAALPIVASDVGGIRAAAADAIVLVSPADVAATAHAVTRMVDDPDLRNTVVAAGLDYVKGRTGERECRRLADFLMGVPGPSGRGPAANSNPL